MADEQVVEREEVHVMFRRTADERKRSLALVGRRSKPLSARSGAGSSTGPSILPATNTGCACNGGTVTMRRRLGSKKESSLADDTRASASRVSLPPSTG